MRSKRSCFNATVFWKNLTRYWPVWVAYLAIWLLILPVQLQNELTRTGVQLLDLRKTALDHAGSTNAILSAIFGIMAAMAVWNYLYTHRSASWAHALPIRREALFCTNFLSGLCGLLAANAAVFLVSLAVEAAGGMVDLPGLLSWLGAVSLCNVFFFSFATLCAHLTGHVLVLPAVYAVLNFVVAAVEFLCRSLYLVLAYGAAFSRGSLSLSAGSPVLYLIANGYAQRVYETAPDRIGVTNALVEVEYRLWPALLIYLAVAAVMILAALALYRRRNTETAGDVVAVHWLRPVFRVCMCFGMALSLGLLLCEVTGVTGNRIWGTRKMLAMIPWVLAAAFIGYYAAEMLMKKTLRVFRKSLPGFFVCCVLLVAGLVLVEFDAIGFESRIPEVGETEQVRVFVSGSAGDAMTFEDPEDIDRVLLLHRTLVDSKEELERKRNDYYYGDTAYDANWGDFRVELVYSLTDGKELVRAYRAVFHENDLQDTAGPAYLTDAVLNCDSAREARLSFRNDDCIVTGGTLRIGERTGYLYEELVLDQIQAQRLYAAALSDLRAGRMGRREILTESVLTETPDCTVTLEARYEYIDREGELCSDLERLGLPLRFESTATLAVLEELTGEPIRSVAESERLANPRG